MSGSNVVVLCKFHHAFFVYEKMGISARVPFEKILVLICWTKIEIVEENYKQAELVAFSYRSYD